jgi:hypothetical protein
MFTAEARHLYSLPANKVPGMADISDRGAQSRWLRLIHSAPAGTQLLTMSGWLRQIPAREPGECRGADRRL